ncbi:dihydrodipicolinate synthase family protein [Solwaraspora sp. WMMD1047]|uniref:dihydrodipicolinate synthase family protein n=1 Tax=Solwaraspora sp. WMMD1047 TaxID=3016102 RepID=UPI002415B6D5|nr:dihydrodipicolinate synthase family protein [Solwaraspora sp. WMMD1047]MDG4830778.1 dihydrodipicolinate synthase family protein [Solwaraspora sp. WMMD1047]
MTVRRPWQGVLVALPTPFRSDLGVDLDRLQEQVRWLADAGCDGVVPGADLGEYQSLTDGERADVVRAATAAAPTGFAVVPGIGGYGARQARHRAEQAAASGAPAVLAPPPTGYPAGAAEVVAHYREVAAVGLPVVADNSPAGGRTDLTPELLAVVAETDGLVAVRELSGDVRRLHRIRDLSPHVDVLAGAGDLLLELLVCGATGWIGALPNALPGAALRLYRLCAGRDLAAALPLYAALHPVLDWDSRPESSQLTKLAMELSGRYGGPCRPPRGPLPPAGQAALRAGLARALRGVLQVSEGTGRPADICTVTGPSPGS